MLVYWDAFQDSAVSFGTVVDKLLIHQIISWGRKQGVGDWKKFGLGGNFVKLFEGHEKRYLKGAGIYEKFQRKACLIFEVCNHQS